MGFVGTRLGVVLGWVLFLGMAGARAESLDVGFDHQGQVLCFLNFDKDLRNHGLLGKWGEKKGVCQGIAGVSAAFFENASFDPDAPKVQGSKQARKLIDQVVDLYERNRAGRVTIPGYADVHAFCADYKSAFLTEVIDLNAKLAITKILGRLPGFLKKKDKKLSTRKDQLKLNKELQSILARLRQGRPAILLYFSHAILVTAAETRMDGDRAVSVELTTYNSNFSGPGTWSIPLDSDGMPTAAANTMFWDITPG